MSVLSSPSVITLVGGSGFIGCHLAKALARLGHGVRILDTRSPPSEVFSFQHVEFIRGSVLDPSAIRQASADAALTMNLAGIVGVQEAHAKPELSHTVAAEGTVNLLDQYQGPVVLFSSSAVYGLNWSGPIAEHYEVSQAAAMAYDAGEHGYACGKLQMERLGCRAARDGRPVIIVRPFNVVGAGQTSAYGMVLPSFIRRALSGHALQVYDDGQQTRSFSDVETFVHALLQLLQNTNAWSSPHPIFNIGSRQATKILDLANKVTTAAATEASIQQLPYAQVFPGRTDVRSRLPDTRKLTNLIGEQDWRSIDQIIGNLVVQEKRRGQMN